MDGEKSNQKCKNLVLFDIDGTLTHNPGPSAHKRSFEIALKKVHGVDVKLDTSKIHGSTDQQIIKYHLEPFEISDYKLEEVMVEINRTFAKIVDDYQICLIPGVIEGLEYLYGINALIGHVTGNLEPIALAKMKKLGISKFFKLGGYGSDHEERSELVRIAVRKASQKYGFVEKNNVFLIGDTPKDIIAAKRAGVKAIAVTTGTFDAEALHEANYVISNMKEISGIILP
ncbi:HAD family hydrolase [Candidatus Woesearchaeota archaeon]|nr:HAD family hydrolase [Candidatus Woesearchaeota archaeon]